MVQTTYEMGREVQLDQTPEVGEVIAEDSTQEIKHAVKDSGEDRTNSNMAWAFCSSNRKIGRKDFIKADVFLSLDLHTVYLIILY